MKFKYDYWADTFIGIDMKRIGSLFEYCVEYGKEYYSTVISRELFVKNFMRSNIRLEMDKGTLPRLFDQFSMDTFKKYVDIDLRGDISVIALKGEETYECYPLQMLWIGKVYAYMHHMTKLASRDVIRVFPFKDMYENYITGHQLSISGFYERAKWKFDEFNY